MSGNEREGAVKPPGATGGAALNPGDEAAPGTPGTGENVCRECKGSGQLEAKPCPVCGGTGKVVEGVSGG